MDDRELFKKVLSFLQQVIAYSNEEMARLDELKKLVRERLSQPEPKPVAWIKEQELAYMSAATGIGETEWKTNLGLKPEPGDVPLYAAPAETPWVKTYAGGKPNYTTPAEKREWVGLTDEEIADSWSKSKGDVLYRLVPFARAIEAKLREKNHG